MTFETPPIREYSDLRIGGVFAYLRQLIIMSIIRENDLEEAEPLYRFYIGQDQIEEDQIHILDSDVNHIKNVLRLELHLLVWVSSLLIRQAILLPLTRS